MLGDPRGARVSSGKAAAHRPVPKARCMRKQGALVGPGSMTWDMGSFKNFPFGERYRISSQSGVLQHLESREFWQPIEQRKRRRLRKHHQRGRSQDWSIGLEDTFLASGRQ